MVGEAAAPLTCEQYSSTWFIVIYFFLQYIFQLRLKFKRDEDCFGFTEDFNFEYPNCYDDLLVLCTYYVRILPFFVIFKAHSYDFSNRRNVILYVTFLGHL